MITRARHRRKAGAMTPAVLLGAKSMSEYKPESDSSDVECPTCGGRFSSERGMKVHHSKIHGVSLAGTEYECKQCGVTFRDHQNRTFCSKDCEATWNAGNLCGENHPRWRDDVRLVCEVCEESYTVNLPRGQIPCVFVGLPERTTVSSIRRTEHTELERRAC